jgi:dolichyl-phosphate beta-glucosyltransferase
MNYKTGIIAKMGVDLSIVIPAYNEEWRLPPTLLDIVDYFDGRDLNYEIIVVDDGSADRTAEVVKRLEKIRQQVCLIQLKQNRGKGHAVKTGVLNSQGKYVLFADADGSTPIKEIERLEAKFNEDTKLVIGSRALPSEDTFVTRRWDRTLLERVFNLCVKLLILSGIADTQCGFKMFTAECAHFLFERQRAERWSFDIEILFMARKAGLKITEVPINWNDVPGSKVNPFIDSIGMFRDIFAFKVRHDHVTPENFEKFTAEFLKRKK